MSVMGVPLSWTNSPFQRPLLLIPSPGVLGFQHANVAGAPSQTTATILQVTSSHGVAQVGAKCCYASQDNVIHCKAAYSREWWKHPKAASLALWINCSTLVHWNPTLLLRKEKKKRKREREEGFHVLIWKDLQDRLLESRLMIATELRVGGYKSDY